MLSGFLFFLSSNLLLIESWLLKQLLDSNCLNALVLYVSFLFVITSLLGVEQSNNLACFFVLLLLSSNAGAAKCSIKNFLSLSLNNSVVNFPTWFLFNVEFSFGIFVIFEFIRMKFSSESDLELLLLSHYFYLLISLVLHCFF